MANDHSINGPAGAADDVLERFSGLLAKLYNAADTQPAERFQAEAFRQLNTHIAFDAGWWALGVDSPEPLIFDTFTHNLSGEMLDQYNQFKDFDVVGQAVSRSPGITFNVRIHEWYPKEYWPYLDVYGFHHALSTVAVDAVTGLTAGITLYRADPQQPFSEAERRFKQALTPHLITMLNRTRINPWTTQAEHILHYPAAAISDTEGGLRYTTGNFGAMLQQEWPDWRGPVLPEPLCAQLGAPADGQFSGKHIAAKITLRQHMPLVQLRAIVPADLLSEQQRKVAQHSADGLNFKEIARLTGLSPATVRTYLTNIYRKLGIKNKIQLAEALREME